MSNNAPSLKEFICSIPICQPEADLGNMLSIFQHLNCRMLAIPQGNLGWGVINSEDLLSLVAETLLGECMTLSSHPRSITYQQSMTCHLIPDVQTLIKPATVYQQDTPIDDFLTSLQYGSLLRDKGVCLIVNQQGELQGKLDRDKIIQYLASKSSLRQKQVVSAFGSELATLMKEIPLPYRIETAVGQVVECNQLWQDLVREQQDKDILPKMVQIPSNEINLEPITGRWISRPNCDQAQDVIDDEGCLNLDQEFKGLEDSNLSIENALDIDIQQRANWNYLKIPLKRKRPQTIVAESYYLVLATPNIQSQKSDSKIPIPNSEVAINQILGSFSHDLKSPLTGIVGLSTLLKEQKLGNLNQRQARYVELIYRSGKKMMSIVNDSLQFTALTVNRPHKLELINLEFLCRQAYQEALTKVQLIEGNNDSIICPTQPQLSIELGSEIAIANKLLLSSVLSHLMLEAIIADETLEPLKIQIKSLSGGTAIIITGQGRSSLSNVGLNWMIAEYLSKLLHARLTHVDASNNSQFSLTLAKNKTKLFCPIDSQTSESSVSTLAKTTTNLTILYLYPDLEVIDPQASQEHDCNLDLQHWSDNYSLQGKYQHRIIEADSLEQAHNLARIWRLDAIILNGYQIAQPSLYLQSLQKSEHLATLPLITLDTQTTEAANQIDGLNVYPCLLPAQQCSIEDLIQVIQIAIES